jgi:hypothetical protein
VVQGDSVVAGILVVKPLDADAQIRVQEWRTLRQSDPSWADEFSAGWKIELMRPADAATFGVRLRVNAASTWKPSAVRENSSVAKSNAAAGFELCRKSGKASLKIRVLANAAQDISIGIYDCRGKRVCPLLVRHMEAGPGVLTRDISNLPSGTYVAIAHVNGLGSASRFVVANKGGAGK